MQNEFEKQVQKKMEELKFVPTEPVWEKIEEQIRKKRDRKRLVLWIPLLFLFLTAGIWWMNSGNVMKNQARLEEKQSSSESSMKNKIDKRNELEKDQQTTQNDQPEKITGKTTLPTQKIISGKKLKKDESFVTDHQKPETWIGNENNTIKNPELISNQKSGTESPQLFDSSASIAQNKPDVVQYKADKIEEIPTTKKEEIKADSIIEAGSVNELPKKLNNQRWKLGLSVNTGISGISKGLNLFDGQKSFSDATSYSQSPSSPTSPSYNNKPSSPVNNSLFFSIGFLAKKQLGKHSFFSTGLEYSYYSTKIEVGRKLRQDTVLAGNVNVNSFYTNASTMSSYYPSNYHNRFHFISIPIGFDFQLLKKIPLFFHTGLSFQQLVKTNALQYSYQSQVYYYDKDAFKKTQFFSELGFHYSIPVKKMSLLLGPELQYGLSRLEKDKPGYHLFSFGLQAQFLFQKR